MSKKPYAWDYVVVSVPNQLKVLPKMWDPRLAWHYASLARNSTVLPVDWSVGRENVDGVAGVLTPKGDPQTNMPREMHLWCSDWSAFNRALMLRERLEKTWNKTTFRILGLSDSLDVKYDKWVGETSLESINLIEPTWEPFNREVYFANNTATEKEKTLYSMFKDTYFEWSPTPYNRSSIYWRQRGSICFRFPAGNVEPSRAARILQKIKQVWWYDSLDWEDDLTADMEWTRKVFDELSDREVSFGFTAKGDYRKTTLGIIRSLRDWGLALIDFGEIPISLMFSPAESERIRSALIACRTSDIQPMMSPVIDADTTLETARSMCGLCTEFRLNNRPEIQIEPGKLTEKELRAISAGKWHNPTKLKDLELLGIMGAFERARSELIR